MKKFGSIVHILTLACAGIILIDCETTQGGAAPAPPTNGAHLLVQRSPIFGRDAGLVLSVDGKNVANLTWGRKYDGYLSPGQHVISAEVYPSRGASPWRRVLTVKNGETYFYTANWSGQALSLVRNR